MVCKCDCGNIKEIVGQDLKDGKTKSCGCLNNDLRLIRSNNYKVYGKVHGMRYTPFYKKWHSMKQRCSNMNTRGYKNYGGRGLEFAMNGQNLLILKMACMKVT